MDTAFERRFLYKIEFEKPEAEARKAIWRSLIDGLPDEEAGVLASRFDFSGGQIENIARRSTVHRVLSGKLPELEELIKFCDMECLGRDSVKKIGFTG
jgi:AAA+ superfamily predicted ATPase